MVFVDAVRKITVAEHLIEDSPTFDHILADNAGPISDFLERIGFPKQALVVRANEPEDQSAAIYKGLRSRPLVAERSKYA